jgi:hypothetical protein
MRFGWFIALPLLFVALLAGSCGYAMGVSSAAVAPAAGVAVHPMWGFGFFPFFGFIFFLVVMFALVGAFKRRAWGGGHGPRGWYGPRSGYGQDRGYSYDPKTGWYKKESDPEFEEWHRRMHGQVPSRPDPRPNRNPNIPDDTLNAPWDPPTPPKDENTQL